MLNLNIVSNLEHKFDLKLPKPDFSFSYFLTKIRVPEPQDRPHRK